jgi:hypothetical protein
VYGSKLKKKAAFVDLTTFVNQKCGLSGIGLIPYTAIYLRKIRNGTALAALFSFKAQFWQDDQFSLTYSLRYLSSSNLLQLARAPSSCANCSSGAFPNTSLSFD